METSPNILPTTVRPSQESSDGAEPSPAGAEEACPGDGPVGAVEGGGDNDDDGIADGTEVSGLDGVPNNGDETDPLNPDSDGDGINDGTESGVTAGVPGGSSRSKANCPWEKGGTSSTPRRGASRKAGMNRQKKSSPRKFVTRIPNDDCCGKKSPNIFVTSRFLTFLTIV